MKIFVTRHGETDWNHANRVLGRPDIPLNTTGQQQAAALAEQMKEIPVDRIYASPLSRALETAQTVANSKAMDVQIDDRLIEQSFGVFEGQKRDDPVYQAEKHQYFKPFEGGESFLDVAARVYPFLKELLQTMGPEEQVLIVTHGGIARIIANYFQGMDNDAFAGFFMKNCQLMEIDPDTGTIQYVQQYPIQ